MSAVLEVSGAEVVEVRDRLVAFVDAVSAGLPHVRQRQNAPVYVRGLLEQGKRKSLEPMLQRLGGSGAEYQSMQQFIADSPWDPCVIVRACVERVAPSLEVEAWVVDDTGFPKQGERSPGVKRQYSGTLGTTGNCQIGVSVHVVGKHGTAPAGWRLYLPEDWCDDLERRRAAKIPDRVVFQTKTEIAGDLVEQLADWRVPRAPVIADHFYGRDVCFRERLDLAGLQYMVAIDDDTHVYPEDTVFAVPPPPPGRGRPPTVVRADCASASVKTVAASVAADEWQQIERATQAGKKRRSQVSCHRVFAASRVLRHGLEPRLEWLIVERRPDRTDYWLSNLPAGTTVAELVRIAHLRWQIELDYKELKDELGLDHYEGRSYSGWHHHAALVTTAHAFLTEERRLRPRR